MNRFFQILGRAWHYKRHAFLNVICNIIYQVFNVVSLLLFIPFLRLLFQNKTIEVSKPEFGLSKDYFQDLYNYKMAEYVNTNDKLQLLIFICITVAIAFLIKNLFRYLALYFLAPIRNGISRDLRKDMYHRILSLPISYFNEEKKGDLLARTSNDVKEVEHSIMGSLEMLFRDPFAIIISLVVLLMISPSLTLFSLLLLPVGALIISLLKKTLRNTSRKGQDKLGELLSRLEETLGGMRIIKAFNAEKEMEKQYANINEDYFKISNKIYRSSDLASPMSEFLGSLVMIILVWYGGSLVLGSNSELDGEEFMGFIIVFSQILRPVQAIANAWSHIMKGAASLDRIEELIAEKPTILDVKDATEISDLKNSISFNEVTFSYDKETVLKGINFELQKGKAIALVGGSGGGKSTIADLVPRFYDVGTGSITIDGKDIRSIKVSSLRSVFGIVTQESILFNDTVFNNIAFGVKASQKEVEAAAKTANAHDFIVKLPNGYHTEIGERGSKLSGGQRQRLSIARAILKNPPILILDEATSALDTESEKLVQEALNNLMENRTSLIIAHRLSTIQHADEILVLKEGEIVERGDHNTLFNANGIYRKLCDMQNFN
ncbi:MAG: ABC transporter ATP-binding protein [Flavobacteriales bacterium]|nr:ABC transporter ATP-binding protein [Flavobacteriales bacterium]